VRVPGNLYRPTTPSKELVKIGHSHDFSFLSITLTPDTVVSTGSFFRQETAKENVISGEAKDRGNPEGTLG
jgi:hypothetical protein